MPATLTQPTPTRPQDPVLQAGLAELFQLGLAVARVASHLAEAEDAFVQFIAAGTADAMRTLAAGPTSLEEVLRAGHEVDDSEAARQAAINRVAAITDSFEKAARAVRRTAALQARLASGRPFPDLPAPEHPSTRQQPATPDARAKRPAPDTDPAEHPDRPETGDELGAKPDEQVLNDIRRDLDAAEAKAPHLPAITPIAQIPAPDHAQDAPPGQTTPPGSLPAPDT